MALPFQRFFLIAMLGLCGVFSRYYTNILAQRVFGNTLPLGTLCVNLVGSFVIGAVFVLANEHKLLSNDLRIALMVGFLGGFTTFSSYTLETLEMFQRERIAEALFYFLGSPILGITMCFAGMWLMRSAVFFRVFSSTQ